MIKPGFIYYSLFAVLFLAFGIYLLFFFTPVNSMLGEGFFTFFGVALLVLGAMRGFKAYQILRKK